MQDDTGSGRLRDREGFVLWIEREAGALRGVLERTATSERIAFDSGERLLALLRGAAAKGWDRKEERG